MTKKRQVYKCALCGMIVEVLEPGAGTLVCCNQPMDLMEENTTDAAVEKHVPVVEKIDGGIRVTVGEVAHPMTEKHLIQWIEVVTDEQVLHRDLAADQSPVAEFKVGPGEVTVRAYCNLHGLWKTTFTV